MKEQKCICDELYKHKVLCPIHDKESLKRIDEKFKKTIAQLERQFKEGEK